MGIGSRARRLLAALAVAAACGPLGATPAVAATGVKTEFSATITPAWAGVGDEQSLDFMFIHDNPNISAPSEGNGATFTMPVDLEVADHPNWWSTDCQGGAVTVTKATVAGTTKITLAGVTVPATEVCQIHVDITSSVAKYTLFADETVSDPTPGVYHWFGDQGVFFLSPAKLTAAFADASILPGGTTMLNVRLDRTDSTQPSLPTLLHTGYELTLPTGLTVAAGTPVTTQCGGGAVLTAAAGTITLTGNTVTLGAACGAQIPVTAAAAGQFAVQGLGFISTGKATLVADLGADVSCADQLCGSPTLSVATVATAPGAADAPSAVAAPGEATVTWAAPASDGGAEVTSYTVRALHAGTAVTGRTCTLTAPFTPPLRCTVGSLTNGTAYTFQVTATNSAGPGAASADSPPVTPQAPPSGPAAPSVPVAAAAVPGNAEAKISWTAPASDGGAPVTSYTAQAYLGGEPVAGRSCTVNAPLLTCTVTGLANGTTYQIRVRATNTAGTSYGSAPVTAVPLAPPPAPAAVTATGGTSSITVDWSAPAAAGAAVTGYTVTAEPGPSVCTTLLTDANPTRCVLGGVAGTTYTFTVVANSASGASAASSASNPATVSAPVAPPVPPQTTLELTTDKGRITTAAPGEQLIVLGSGFAANSTATITIYSDPVSLGTVVTDASGNFTKPVTIPAGLATGGHSVVAQGVDPDGNAHAMRLDVTVGTTALAVTGAGVVRVLAAGLATLAAGLVMLRAGRPRRPRGTHLLPPGVAYNPA